MLLKGVAIFAIATIDSAVLEDAADASLLLRCFRRVDPSFIGRVEIYGRNVLDRKSILLRCRFESASGHLLILIFVRCNCHPAGLWPLSYFNFSAPFWSLVHVCRPRVELVISAFRGPCDK